MNDTVTETIKYVFTTEEIIALADRLQRETRRLLERRAEKKIASDRFGEQNGLCSALLRKIADGFEQREVEAQVILNSPRDGMKQTVYNGEILREEKMSDLEKQQPLDFDGQGKRK
jgi:CRISPR/Cas system Type II protein with McrA/HNH and RuvC-like nuclease domain